MKSNESTAKRIEHNSANIFVEHFKERFFDLHKRRKRIKKR